MLSSPYPVPSLRVYRVAMVLGWVAGMGAGAWVLVSPPQSYDALGITLTPGWGGFLLGGSRLVAWAHAFRKYKIEIPGLVLALGGVVAKARESTYQPGKRVMTKIKHARTAEAVLLGYRVHKSGQGVGSLLLGL